MKSFSDFSEKSSFWVGGGPGEQELALLSLSVPPKDLAYACV